MASPLRLQVHGTDEAAAAAAWRIVTETFAAADAALSRHREDSELTALNRRAGSGQPLLVGRELYAAVSAADRARRLTDGRFDARVLGVLERLGDHGAPLSPSPSAAPAIACRDPRRRAVVLDRPYDLGGIGKGLALRWTAHAVAPHVAEASGWLLEAGGDIVVGGRPDDAPAWAIAIEEPGSDGPPVAVLDVSEGAVCTSSIGRRRWLDGDGRPVHHLIDPRTGEPGGGGLAAVTVAGPDPAWSEVWSKALFLVGSIDIGDIARARGLAAWWVAVDGSLGMTPAARLRTAWTRADSTPG